MMAHNSTKPPPIKNDGYEGNCIYVYRKIHIIISQNQKYINSEKVNPENIRSIYDTKRRFLLKVIYDYGVHLF